MDYEENEEDYGYYHQEDVGMDEKCWKVRRAILHYITYLVKKDRGFRDKVAKSEEFIQTLGSKLIEENKDVNETAIEAFNSLLEAITTEKHHSK